jgi:hypothetical protein
VLEKEEEEEAQMDEGVVEKRNEYTRENLLKNLTLSEPSDFQNFLRLDATSFDDLLKMITPRTEKRILLCEMLFLQASVCQLLYVTLLLEILLKT